jgi:catechol 2,3-dioxygenase-like lactoylglutathione lyase family enzyme
MAVLGIDEVTYRADDLAACKQFFLDWGLTLHSESESLLVFHTLNECIVRVAHAGLADLPAGLEEGPTIVEVVWGVASDADMAHYAQTLSDAPGFTVLEQNRLRCIDPNGLTIGVQVSRKKAVDLPCAQFNTWSHRPRVNQASPAYERATPIEVGHVVFYVDNRAEAVRFYEDKLGFVVTDQYPNRGSFMRCAPRGGHHDLFLLQLPSGKKGLNHVAFTVRDIHEVIGGGMAMDRLGWTTELGPGRHPLSSAYFWYFENPAGGLIEYYADEDEMTGEWQCRDFEPGPTRFAEWAVAGGIDGNTRRPKGASNPTGKFLTDKTNGSK